MKISKHSHSCLLLATEQKTILIDPGVYTEQDQALDIDKLEALDTILITHSHADHLSILLLQRVLEKFPEVSLVTNDETRAILEKEGIHVEHSSDQDITLSPATHEKIPLPVAPPENTLFTIFEKFTHPGDSFDFTSSSEILALPITAPWGSTTHAVEKALEVKPKIIIPIHDWHWKNVARQQFYTMLQGVFANEGIEFKMLENNEVIEV